MSEQEQKWFVAERAKALAMVHLTRRDDLVIVNPVEGVGLQFIVYIKKEEGEPAVRQFGVYLLGTKSPVTVDHLNKVLRPQMQGYARIGHFPYPVLVFHFSMDDDQGYYTWVSEPAILDGGPRLLMHEGAHSRILDRHALDEIVQKVDLWYDAFFRKIAVQASRTPQGDRTARKSCSTHQGEGLEHFRSR